MPCFLASSDACISRYGKRLRLPPTSMDITHGCIRQRLSSLIPVPASFPGGMGPPQHPQCLPGTFPSPGISFTQENIDMVLYGYARIRGNRQIPGHALSGLRIGELSYGEYYSVNTLDPGEGGCMRVMHLGLFNLYACPDAHCSD